MRYAIEVRGTGGLIMHNGTAGLDKWSPAKVELGRLAAKKDSSRTAVEDARMRHLETYISLYLDNNGEVTFPAGGIRTCIESAARKLKQGPMVREGLIVDSVDEFIYDRATLGKTADEVARNAQFIVPVVINRGRQLKSRARFEPWGVKFTIDVDPEIVDEVKLGNWLDIAGRRIGLGDWRPEKSGHHGRFDTDSIQAVG